MYTLNFLFDFNDANGRFVGDRGNNPLLKSRNWLQLDTNVTPEPANPGTFDPEPNSVKWIDLGEADTLLLPSNPAPGTICVRIAPDPTANPFAGFDPATATLQVILAFGAPAKARPNQVASPFTTDDTAGGPVRSTFVFGPATRNTTAGWFFPLGHIQARPSNANIVKPYEFAVGVIVKTPSGVIRTYGDDPEMDVGA